MSQHNINLKVWFMNTPNLQTEFNVKVNVQAKCCQVDEINVITSLQSYTLYAAQLVWICLRFLWTECE